MNNLIAWWAKNSVAANLLMIGLFVAGFISFNSMEREMEPQVRFPGLQIHVTWPGASPQEVEEQIVARIEESVRDLDAIEWVQLPNTRGMSQFADGGKIATKPYISSGSYIHKMSNYCDTCFYNKNKKTEDDACPFNSLYWNFLDEKKEQLSGNFRMKMMYSLLHKMPNENLIKIKEKANHIINNLDEY